MMAKEELEQIEDEDLHEAEVEDEDDLLEATDDEETEEELVEFQASGEASSVPDPIETGSSRRKADKTNAMPMQKLGKTGVIAQVVDAMAGMTPGQAGKVYKGITSDAGNKSSIKAKENPGGKVKLHTMANIKVKEDLESLFGDQESLTEDFFDKAATIFEAALNVKATIVEEALKEEFDRQLAEATEQLEEEYEKKIDDYLNYVADTWMEENEIAIESALKVEMAENFLTGLQQMFVENHIEIPEDKADHFGEMEAKIDELEEQLNKEVDEKIALTSAMKDQKVNIAFHEKSTGLTLKQKDEFNDLVEGLEYDNIEDCNQKMDVILETYFNKPAATDTAVDESEPVDVDEEGAVTRSDPSMAAYAQAISRTLRS
jgi:hypothetical protein